MKNSRLILAFFAAAILFSMVREWSAPVTCPRTGLITEALVSSTGEILGPPGISNKD